MRRQGLEHRSGVGAQRPVVEGQHHLAVGEDVLAPCIGSRSAGPPLVSISSHARHAKRVGAGRAGLRRRANAGAPTSTPSSQRQTRKMIAHSLPQRAPRRRDPT